MSLDLPADLVDNDLGETPQKRLVAIKAFRESILQLPANNRIEDLSDENLIRFLRGKKYNMEKALKCVKNRAKFHREHAQLIDGATAEEFERLGKILTLLPQRSVDGKLVILLRPTLVVNEFKDKEFMENNPLIVARLMIWIFNRLSDNVYVQVCGVVIMGSMKEMSLWDAMTFIGAAKNEDRALAIGYLTTCTAARFGGMMLFDQPAIVTPVFYVITLFMSSKLRERMHLCGSDYSRVQEHLGNDASRIPECIGGSQNDSDCIYWIPSQVARDEILQDGSESRSFNQEREPETCGNVSCLSNICTCGSRRVMTSRKSLPISTSSSDAVQSTTIVSQKSPSSIPL